MSSELQVLILSMAPISELRGAIPVGIITFNLPFWEVFLISIFGNLIPVLFILLFFESVNKLLSKKSLFFKSLFSRIFENTKVKFNPWIKKYGNLALALFVAVPLPLTGGWTGAIAAFLFGLPFKTAFPFISLGVFIAGVIVSLLTLGGVAIDKYFGWQTLFGVLIIVLFIYLFYKLNQRRSA